MKKDNGFFLVELLLYLTLCVFFVTCICGALTFFLPYISKPYRYEAALYGTVQAIRRDLCSAPATSTAYTITETSCSYNDGNKIVAWYWKPKKKFLMRSVEYSSQKTRDATTILNNVEAFSLKVKAKDNNITFCLAMTHNGRKIAQKCYTRCGYV